MKTKEPCKHCGKEACDDFINYGKCDETTMKTVEELQKEKEEDSDRKVALLVMIAVLLFLLFVAGWIAEEQREKAHALEVENIKLRIQLVNQQKRENDIIQRHAYEMEVATKILQECSGN